MSYITIQQQAEKACEESEYKSAIVLLDEVAREISRCNTKLSDREYNSVMIENILRKAAILKKIGEVEAANKIYACIPLCKHASPQQIDMAMTMKRQ
ncbi:MAG TPA: hypothetical protein PLZ62_02530 [bacterium]|nr:hypothetical protein [bacterium]